MVGKFARARPTIQRQEPWQVVIGSHHSVNGSVVSESLSTAEATMAGWKSNACVCILEGEVESPGPDGKSFHIQNLKLALISTARAHKRNA